MRVNDLLLKRVRTFQGPTPPGAGSTELSDMKYAWVKELLHCSTAPKKGMFNISLNTFLNILRLHILAV